MIYQFEDKANLVLSRCTEELVIVIENENERTKGRQFCSRTSRPCFSSDDCLIKEMIVYLQCDPFAIDGKKIAS